MSQDVVLIKKRLRDCRIVRTARLLKKSVLQVLWLLTLIDIHSFLSLVLLPACFVTRRAFSSLTIQEFCANSL